MRRNTVKNNKLRNAMKNCLAVGMIILLLCQLISVVPGLNGTISWSQTQAAAAGKFEIIPGNFYFGGSATNGYNFFHIEGNEANQPPNSFWQNTFCIEKDHSSAPGNQYTYYYNTGNSGDLGFADFESIVLGANGIDMTKEEWARFRYCILYVSANKDARGQYALWSGLGHFLPTKYSRAGSFGDAWQDVWSTKYFGASGTANFMGMGPILTGETLDLGTTVDVSLNYPVGFDPTGTSVINGRIGPFQLRWAAGSDPVLAQLNSGASKNAPPVFNLGTSNSSVRFYKDATTSTPTSSTRVGDDFYIEWNDQAKSGGVTDIKVSCVRELITKVVADQHFLNPVAQNQASVQSETGRPEMQFKVRTPDYNGPDAPADLEEYVRPAVEKQVAEDYYLDNTGSFQDILGVYPGTGVFHKMTVTSQDPKGTILTFQNTDYDLYPSALHNHASGWEDQVPLNTALVKDAAALKAAIDENKNIKLMADVTIPANWIPSGTVYNGIFDGNNYKLIGDGGTMSRPIFSTTLDAVFYRVQFVGFTMVRNENSGTPLNGTFENFGALVDVFSRSTNGQAKMLDCYINGKLTVDVSGSTAMQFDSVGGVAGRANGEFYGVQALLELTIDCATDRFFGYGGGLFGEAKANVFENNELLKGSVVTSGNQIFGGIAGAIWVNTDIVGELKILNCKADYTFYNGTRYSNNLSSSRERRFGGMFYFTDAHISLIDRCIVNCTYFNKPQSVFGSEYGHVNVFSGLLGELYNRNNSALMVRTISNCVVNFSGDNAVISSVGSITQRGQLGSGAGILNLGCDGQSVLNHLKIENCNVKINMSTGNNAGAGILNDVRRRSDPGGASYTQPVPYTIEISDCKVDGQIIGTGESTIAGIATDTAVNFTRSDVLEGMQSGSIRNCIVTADLTADAGRVGGIWATRHYDAASGSNNWSKPIGSHSGVMAIENCLYSGTITDNGAVINTSSIFACLEVLHTTCVAALNNFATSDPLETDDTAPNGKYADVLDLGYTWYNSTLGINISNAWTENSVKTGLDSPTWYLRNGNDPMIATAYRWPIQRIYVTDYYHQNNTQEFIEKLYVWEGGQFKHIWDSQYLSRFYSSSGDMDITGDAAGYVDLRIPNGQNSFTFYYFVSDHQAQSKAAGENGPWNRIDGLLDTDTGNQLWQNTVKITPKDNVIVDDNSGGKRFDWPGDYDDDWVYCTEDEAETYFNIIKMTNTAGFPVPLEGCTFTLFHSDTIYRDFTGINLTDPEWGLVQTFSPSGFGGVENPPILTEGSYVLVETTAPDYYKANEGTKWYLVFENGLPEMYSDPALTPTNRIALGEEEGANTRTYSAILDNGRANAPLAKISLIKLGGDNEPVSGTMTENGTHFTGAIYGLYKYASDSFSADSYSYGNPLVFGAGQQNWCEIEPGYYEMVEIKAPDGYVLNTTPIYIIFDSTSLVINGNQTTGSQTLIYSRDNANEIYVTVQHSSVNMGNLIADATINARNIQKDPSVTPTPPTPSTTTTTPTTTTTTTARNTGNGGNRTTTTTTTAAIVATTQAPELTTTSSFMTSEEPMTMSVELESDEVIRISEPTFPIEEDGPPVSPGNTLERNSDGTYTEFDENGIPLGNWVLDDDGEWVFEPIRVQMPKTGDSVLFHGIIGSLLVSFGAVGSLLYAGKRKKEAKK